MSTPVPFHVRVPSTVTDADDPWAVTVEHGQMLVRFTIAQAREIGLALERAADEAEAKLG